MRGVSRRKWHALKRGKPTHTGEDDALKGVATISTAVSESEVEGLCRTYRAQRRENTTVSAHT